MKIKNIIQKLLLWSEKYTKTDMLYLFKGSFWLTFRQIFFSLTAFLVAIAFAHLLPKEVYGNYKYILSIAGILTITTLSRIDTAVILAVARGFEGVVKDAFKTKIKWGLIGSIGAIGVAIYFLTKGNTEFAISSIVIAIFLPLMEASQIYLSFLSGKKLFDLHAKYNSIIRIIASLAIIVTIILTNKLIYIIFAYFIFYTLLRSYFYYSTLKKLSPNNKTDPQFILYGKQLSLLRIIIDMATYLDKILVFKFIGPVELAIYSFAIIPVDHIQTLFQSIRLIATPKFSVGHEEQTKKALPSKIIRAMFITITIVIIYIIFIPYFYQIFFPQYIEAVNFSRYYSLVLILFPFTIINTYFEAKIKKREVYLFYLGPPTIRIILLLILAPIYGIIGILSAILIASICNALLSIAILKINLKSKLNTT